MPPPSSRFRESERRFRACASAAEAVTRGALDLAAQPPPPCAGVSSGGGGGGGGGGVVELRPGLFVLPSFLCAREQRALALLCLTRWSQRPHRRNTDALAEADDAHDEAAGGGGGGTGVDDDCGAAAAAPGAEGATEAAPLEPDGTMLREYGAATAPAISSATPSARSLPAAAAAPRLLSVRWSCLGLHYDWTARAYHLAADADFASASRGGAVPWRSGFPRELTALGARVLRRVARRRGARRGGGEGAEGASAGVSDCSGGGVPGDEDDGGGSDSFGECGCDSDGNAASGETRRAPASPPSLRLRPDAAIVNYYAPSSASRSRSKLPMGAHRDDLERSLAHPVVSVSLGRAAVFLVEASDADAAADAEAPFALLLRSGDAVVLSGAARLALHGVAAVFDEVPAGDAWAEAAAGGPGGGENAGGDDDDEAVAAAARFMRGHRVNVNIRQCCE